MILFKFKIFSKMNLFCWVSGTPPKNNDTSSTLLHCYIWQMCVCVCVCVCVCSVAQSCLTLCNPLDCSPLGSSVHGISPARILE